MRGFSSTTRLRPLPAALAMLAMLVLGLGLGPVLASDRQPGQLGTGDGASIDLTRHASVIIEGDAGSRGSLTVSCRSGTVIGGGFSAGRNVRITESRPHGIRSWRISWLQTSDDDSVAYAYAVCMGIGPSSRSLGS